MTNVARTNILSTSRLFCRLLRTFEIATVCDVGSMDGTDALRFRRMLPRAAILALEPNPRNFELMAADARLHNAGIRILPVAASDSGAAAPFYVMGADYRPGYDQARRGRSSLYLRSDAATLEEVVQVPTVRLDDLLGAESLGREPIALWIDAEGAAFEVVRGAAGILSSVRLIHVEVETAAAIGANQKQFPDVLHALTDAGFALVATDQPPCHLQFNALCVRSELLRSKGREIRAWANIFRLRRTIGRKVIRVVPRGFARAFRARPKAAGG